MRDVRNSPEVKFPFRVTAMALPLEWQDIDFSKFAKFSQLLGYGLSEQQTLTEVFTVNRQRVVYSDETVKRTPLDTFKAGLGECIHANELAGTMLEINGLRFRTVGGFNPTVRTAYPGADHAAIEVLRSDGTWGYMDPYLDVYSPGVSAKGFSGHPVGGIVAFEIDRKKFKSAEFGNRVTLADLFKYRMYSDSGGRLPPAAMTQLIGAEEHYGRNWELRDLNPDEHLDIDRDLPRRLEVYVRGRYIISNCRMAHATIRLWIRILRIARPISSFSANC